MNLMAPSSATYATFEHLLARSLGGSNDEGNVVLACRRCNWNRGDGIANRRPHHQSWREVVKFLRESGESAQMKQRSGQ